MKPVLPGATVGVLGSGQLGRMFAIAARRMGYRVHTFSPDADTPTGQVADLEVIAPYDDLDAVRRFASSVSVVTFEFENVPAPTAQAAAQHAPVRPNGEVLHATQHRIREKTFLTNAGLPLTPFRTVHDLRRPLPRRRRPRLPLRSSKPPTSATTAKAKSASLLPIKPKRRGLPSAASPPSSKLSSISK